MTNIKKKSKKTTGKTDKKVVKKIKKKLTKHSLEKLKNENFRKNAIFAIFLVLSIFFYVLIFDFNRDSEVVGRDVPSVVLEKPKQSTMLDFVNSGEDITCELISFGKVIYRISDRGIRVEGLPLKIKLESETGDYRAIFLKDWLYYWRGEKGVKVNLSKLTPEAQKEIHWKTKVEDFTHNENEFTCQKSNHDPVFFVPPLAIEFKDVTSQFDK